MKNEFTNSSDGYVGVIFFKVFLCLLKCNQLLIYTICRKFHVFAKLFFSMAIFYPVAGSAHVKWFADPSKEIVVSDDNWFIYSIVWAVIAASIVMVGVFLEKKLTKTLAARSLVNSTHHFSEKFEYSAASIFSILIGVYFLTAAYHGFLFSLNLDDVGQWHSVLIGIEAFVGFSFLFGIGVRQSSLVFLMLWVFSLFYVGALNTLENLGLLGIAIFVLIYGRRYFRYTREDIALHDLNVLARRYAIPVLRVAIGVNLILLGFSEKILRPDLGLSFLEEHPWNFMKNYGLEWYSDYLFVFSAGAVEIILGLVLTLGILTRVCAGVIAIIFLIPPFFMGVSELVGHMPHLSIIVILILFGSGDVLTLRSTSATQRMDGTIPQYNRIKFTNVSVSKLPISIVQSRNKLSRGNINIAGKRRRTSNRASVNKSRIPYLSPVLSGKNTNRSKVLRPHRLYLPVYHDRGKKNEG
ncbi:MAG: DoxX family protein [Gammaproteobacteria bacterium]|nr:DoxX family protein [Gammaproteobacteria bacterium]